MKATDKVKHTPGPWKINPDYPEEVIMRHEMSFLARCTSEHEDEAVANAKLIALAPELLKALETIKGAFWTDGESKNYRIADLKSIAEHAIKKATS